MTDTIARRLLVACRRWQVANSQPRPPLIGLPCSLIGFRGFAAIPARRIDGRRLEKNEVDPETQKDPNSFDEAVVSQKVKQTRTPWHREGSGTPPVRRMRSAGAMTKGKLLSTPSRLLKLVLPLTTIDKNSDRKDIEPLALLVHPQQPLSYLERLIQSELPTIATKDGREKVPSVFFRAVDTAKEQLDPGERGPEAAEEQDLDDGLERSNIGGKIEKTGVLNRKRDEASKKGEGGVETYSGAGREKKDAKVDRSRNEDSNEKDDNFVRWSSSTDIGDFIRDAARGKEFAVAIEGAPREIRVGVPSFNDRTFYLRQRLRRTAGQISQMASVKKECDEAAQRSAQKIALAGFGGLAGWWICIYYLTFKTDLGWDTMEPVTYLVGLSGLMAGYLWFLYHNREVSYRAALNLTVNRRQAQLYQAKGFNVERWESLIKDGNELRHEIKTVAADYDVEWDERKDEHDEQVMEALRKSRGKKKEGKEESGKKSDDDDDD